MKLWFAVVLPQLMRGKALLIITQNPILALALFANIQYVQNNDGVYFQCDERTGRNMLAVFINMQAVFNIFIFITTKLRKLKLNNDRRSVMLTQ